MWLESFAQKPYALWVLFSVSFVEASFFPLSVDVPLIALGVAFPKKSLLFGAVATIGSFLGGYLGYYIGYAVFDIVGKSILNFHGIMETFQGVLGAYRQHGMSALVFSGFTPLPYITFTIAAGFHQTIDLWTLTVGALIGRTLRFFSVGVLLYFFGEQSKSIMNKYFEIATVAFVVLIIIGIVYFKWLL